MVLLLQILGLFQEAESDGDGHEADQHAGGRGHERKSAAETGDKERNQGAVEERPALVGNVDSGLGVVAGETHHAVNGVGIVGKQGIAGHLGEQTQECGDEDTTTHTGGAEHGPPGLLGVLHLELDGGLDLGHLGEDDVVVRIIFAMVLDEDGERLIVSVLADEPTGAFWEKACYALVSAPHNLAFLVAYKTVHICRREGQICKSDGTRQFQLLFKESVPMAIEAAKMEPMK